MKNSKTAAEDSKATAAKTEKAKGSKEGNASAKNAKKVEVEKPHSAKPVKP